MLHITKPPPSFATGEVLLLLITPLCCSLWYLHPQDMLTQATQVVPLNGLLLLLVGRSYCGPAVSERSVCAGGG